MKFFLKSLRNVIFLTILIFTLSLKNNLEAKDFKSKFNFEFQLTDNYQIINNTNLYQVYNSSHDDPKIKQQINMFSQRLKEQDVEILFNFKQSLLDNISILAFKGAYKVDEKRVVKQCKKILKIEKKFGKRNVDIIECRMHNYPKFADWSMYRENESSYFKGVTTQQIIFMFNKTEFVITVACTEKCEQTKVDLFSLVKSIRF
ncbi:hypothetical protein OA333_00855 [Candidatus Pelagibacter sp.]|nr:hypothetical protein [Candidatus Pelagibacter sp.]